MAGGTPGLMMSGWKNTVTHIAHWCVWLEHGGVSVLSLMACGWKNTGSHDGAYMGCLIESQSVSQLGGWNLEQEWLSWCLDRTTLGLSLMSHGVSWYSCTIINYYHHHKQG
jgi:hypothetical protein